MGWAVRYSAHAQVREQLSEAGSRLSPVNLGGQTQLIKLGGKGLPLLSHLHQC